MIWIDGSFNIRECVFKTEELLHITESKKRSFDQSREADVG